jgi:ABC-type sugar transport system ATPase subunit
VVAALLELRSISKSYGPVEAVRSVSFHGGPGEILAIVGDNGAGKSTMLKVLSGAHRPSTGTVVVRGEELTLRSPLDAEAVGIEAVYQDLALVETLDVASNILLGRETARRGLLGALGFINKGEMRRISAQVLHDQLGVKFGSLRRPVETLSGGQRQAVAIARAAARVEEAGEGIILLDEPTAALGVAQTERVKQLVRRLSTQRHLVIVVSHDLSSVFDLASRILVMRLGRLIADVTPDQVDLATIVGLITGAVMPATIDPEPAIGESASAVDPGAAPGPLVDSTTNGATSSRGNGGTG